MQCVILAGGLSTRLKGLFGEVPKHLVPVNGRPFADWQTARLAEQGFTRLTYALGFGAASIEDYLRECLPTTILVDFEKDGDSPLGTGGALRHLLDREMLEDIFALTYGDTLLTVNPRQMFDRLKSEEHAECVLAVWRNGNLLGRSNADFDGNLVTEYDKAGTRNDLQFIDYGMMVLRKRAVERLIPKGVTADLSLMMAELSHEGRMLGHEVHGRFYEIGTIEALRETEAFLAAKDEIGAELRPPEERP